MRPIFRVSTDEEGYLKKIEFLYKDGLVEDITESVLYDSCSVRVLNNTLLALNIEVFAVTGETIKEAK